MPLSRDVLFRVVTNERLERAVRSVQPGERLAWKAASRYVAGGTVEDALRVARELHRRGATCAIDHFGELVDDPGVALRVTDGYLRLASELGGTPDGVWLAVDLSHLGVDIDPRGCADRLASIAGALPEGRRIQVGAEDAGRADAILACVLDVAGRGVADRMGATAQANLRRTPSDLERLVAAGVHVRLVKGAYVEPAGRALPFGEPTDIAYLRLAHRLAAAGASFALATHDGVLREALLAALGPVPVEQLFGVRPDVLTDLLSREVPVRVYVPYGHNWFRYLMRRLAESRGA